MSHEDVMQLIQHNEEVFEVRQECVIGKFLILHVFFPQCPNGDKIMVYREPQTPVKPYVRINPHFNLPDSPFARFEPTEKGWDAAVQLAEIMFMME